MSSNSLNYPLLAIPAYYVFSLVPHVYATTLLVNNGYKPNNASPKSSLSPSKIQGKVPDAVLQQFIRGEAAHSNNMENMPFFVAAVLASIIAERSTAKGLGNVVAGDDVTGLMTFVAAWFAARTAYTVAYLTITDHSKSFVRSSFWAIGSGLCGYQIFKAAQVLR